MTASEEAAEGYVALLALLPAAADAVGGVATLREMVVRRRSPAGVV